MLALGQVRLGCEILHIYFINLDNKLIITSKEFS